MLHVVAATYLWRRWDRRIAVLPRVDFCGISMTRLIIGANPFSGYSHQAGECDRAMSERAERAIYA
jgi:hypothetical protein